MALDSTSRSAARSCTRRRSCCASAPTSSPATMTQEQGKPLDRSEARSARLGAAVRLVRRGRQARLRPHARPPRGPAQPRDPPAGRPDRDLHAVEFPDLSAGEEGQRRARRRLHRDLAPAARNARRRHRAVPRARRRRHSQRRRAAGPRRQRPGQRDAHRQPRHPQGQLHRLDQRRQASDAPVRRQHDPRDDGARRPRAGADLRRLRPRKDARHGRPAEVPERRPGVRLADPLLRPERHLRRVHQGLRRAHRQGEGRQRPRGRTRRWARSPTAAAPTRSTRWSQDAKAKGARVLAGGERGDGGFFFQPTLLADVPNEAEHHERRAVRPGRRRRARSTRSRKRSSRPTACPTASPPSPSPKTAAART